MGRQALTQLAVQKIKPPKSRTTRVERYDALVPGFGVRVTPEGTRSWIFVYRSPTSGKRRRYTIGTVEFETPDGKISFNLEQARLKASRLRDTVGKKRDPADEREAVEAAAVAEAKDATGRTFKAVFELFAKRELAKYQRGEEYRRIVERMLIEKWGHKPIDAITAIDVQERIEVLLDERKPEAARTLYETIRLIFNWAVARPSLKLDRAPTDRMKPTKLIGKKVKRTRVLSKDEIRACWGAAIRTGYPFGHLVRTLMLSALRRDEAADTSRGEFDRASRLWTVPAERMKKTKDVAHPHVVPLTDDLVALIDAMPEFTGPFLFTTNDGTRPISGYSKMKQRFDKLMLEELRKIATERGDRELTTFVDKVEDLMRRLDKAKGEQRQQCKLELKAIWWVLHDIRRTVRTHLSALPVQDLVRELVLAHAKPGLHQVYDQYAYLDEKREALTLWAARLRSIVDPPPDNVVEFERRATG